MALTVTLDGGMPRRVGKLRLSTGTLAFDSSYPTNGESLAATALGFRSTCYSLEFVGGDAATKRCSWDKTNAKVLVFLETGGTFAEQGNGTDPGLSAVRFTAWGD